MRMRQVMSITETQWRGQSIVIISPDSDNLSVIQVRCCLYTTNTTNSVLVAPMEQRWRSGAGGCSGSRSEEASRLCLSAWRNPGTAAQHGRANHSKVIVFPMFEPAGMHSLTRASLQNVGPYRHDGSASRLQVRAIRFYTDQYSDQCSVARPGQENFRCLSFDRV